MVGCWYHTIDENGRIIHTRKTLTDNDQWINKILDSPILNKRYSSKWLTDFHRNFNKIFC